MPDPALIEASEATRARYVADSAELDETSLLRLLSIVDQSMDHVRSSRQPRLRLELALLKMASLPSSVDLKAVLEGLGASGPPPRRERKVANPRTGDGTAPPERAALESGPKAPPLPSPALPASDSAASSPSAPDPAPAKPAGTDPSHTEDPPAEAEAPRPPAGPTLFDSGAGPDGAQPSGMLGRPALEVSVVPARSRPDVADEVAVADDGEAGTEPAWWPDYIERVKDERIHVGALLHHATASTAADGTLRIEVPDDFHVRVLSEETDALKGALEADGARLAPGVRVVRGTAVAAGEPTDEAPDPEQRIRDLCEEYPALGLLMERFGGEIVW